jgi:hypothetical protein
LDYLNLDPDIVLNFMRDGWLSREGWVAKSVARQLATAVLWVRIQTSLKNHKWATLSKEWPTHSSPPKKNIQKKESQLIGQVIFSYSVVNSSMKREGEKSSPQQCKWEICSGFGHKF